MTNEIDNSALSCVPLRQDPDLRSETKRLAATSAVGPSSVRCDAVLRPESKLNRTRRRHIKINAIDLIPSP